MVTNTRRRFGWSLPFAGAALALSFYACAPTPKSELDPHGLGASGGTGGTTTTTTTTTNAGGFDPGTAGGGGAGGFIPCVSTPDNDFDSDGYTAANGDCNDCDANVNPNAVEVLEPGVVAPHDENCNGVSEELRQPCDGGMVIAEQDPIVALQAIEVCKLSNGPGDWGLVSAAWVMADGSPPPPAYLQQFHLGHGVLPGFGPNQHVRRGASMLALSSGTARRPGDPGYQNVSGYSKGYTGSHPQGFPKESPACPNTTTGEPHDVAGIEAVMRTPANAYGFSFDFDFYTFEWPGYVCSEYNDFFVALLSPFPPNQTDGNIVFDNQQNPISVNNAFLDVCGCIGNPPIPCQAGGKTFPCTLGDVELIGTGFGFDSGGEDHGATSWLQTSAPVAPHSDVTLRFAVYDSGDGVLDTTALIDDFRWIAKPGVTVGTIPVPN